MFTSDPHVFSAFLSAVISWVDDIFLQPLIKGEVQNIIHTKPQASRVSSRKNQPVNNARATGSRYYYALGMYKSLRGIYPSIPYM